ncbi:UDP-glucose dehydrogenase family protein [Humibacillus xanthopallidus]|uniref:UDP-glucose 6-dehydrogenase n=1 Tax=Humibacillus xanthopallidus TaxID=412689 RepID=A0A543HHU6_9MICO|nr:UDP-glucose/GDP-mannose dehydrogenase family protein [Humibacillus xanthopallidus]TQM57892.1 UDPglucose 6-dehydrogenase [Humibacillus xanthopallidus]
MRISVFGTGYLGATHAATLAHWGHEVVGIDVDPHRVRRLAAARPPFHEPGFAELLTGGVTSGRLTFSTELDAVGDADLHFLCVGTPQLDGSRAADLRAVWSAVDALLPRLGAGALVVGRSTVPVGTATLLQQRLDEALGAGRAEVAWNPEFLREAHAVEDSLRPDRLVVGAGSDDAADRICAVYAPLIDAGVPVVRTDPCTAELAKSSANVVLASRISVVNVLAEVCEAAGADIERLTEVLGLDPRIGPHYLSPGLGFGGGCLPKDLRAFASRAAELGVSTAAQLLDAVDEVNTHQRHRTVQLATDLLGGTVRDRHIGVLGAAFKADSDDIRDSPALAVASALAAAGACVTVHDPKAAHHLAHRRDLRVADGIDSACAGADLTMVLTDWPAFAAVDPAALSAVVQRRVVVDARLSLDVERWRAAGWDVRALGRPREVSLGGTEGSADDGVGLADPRAVDRDLRAG